MPFAYATSLRSASPGKFALLATWDTERTSAITASFYTTKNPFPWDPEHTTLDCSLDGPNCHLSSIFSNDPPTCPGLKLPSSVSSTYVSCPAVERRGDIAHAERAFVDPSTGDPVYATYYPPTNPDYDGGVGGERPPVVVNVHGGPTDFSHHGLNWEVQFFTSRGFAWYARQYCRPFAELTSSY